MSQVDSKGLAGVIAGKTAISTVGQDGVGLTYRGYAIDELAAKACFEEVAYLLIYSHLPNHDELNEYRQRLKSLRALPEPLIEVLQLLPGSTHPMDVLRTGCSFLGTIEPESAEYDHFSIADRLVACFPSMLAYWYHFHRGKVIDTCTDEDSTAGHFLTLLHGRRPEEIFRRALDISLILYAEHEFNASTFAARVTAGTLSDCYSAMTSAIGTLRGPLHGGANEEALTLMERFTSADEATRGIKSMLENKALIMGFGHRVYRDADPRSAIIKALSKQLAAEVGGQTMFAVAEAIERVMWDEKHLFPNLDFFSATAYHFCDIPKNLFTPIFVMSRTTGWMAHIIEQSADNRLIRPNAEYIGPEQRSYLSIEERVFA